MAASFATMVPQLQNWENQPLALLFFFLSLTSVTRSQYLLVPDRGLVTCLYHSTYIFLPITHEHSILIPLSDNHQKPRMFVIHVMQSPPSPTVKRGNQHTHPLETDIERRTLPEQRNHHPIESSIVGDIPRFPDSDPFRIPDSRGCLHLHITTTPRT